MVLSKMSGYSIQASLFRRDNWKEGAVEMAFQFGEKVGSHPLRKTVGPWWPPSTWIGVLVELLRIAISYTSHFLTWSQEVIRV
jgi:hypothetical protein